MMRTRWLIFFALMAAVLMSCLDSFEDPNAQLNAELKQIDDYLEMMGLTDQVLYDNTTNMRFIINNYGQDPPPHTGQKVRIEYEGRLFSDGTTFSSGELYDNIEAITPNGLMYGVEFLLKGSSATLYIPSQHGYGKSGTSSVPANAILVYTVHLKEVEKTSAETHQFQIDTAAIHSYLQDNTISNAIQHSSGIWYTIDEQGSGSYSTVYNHATFQYKLKLLSNAGAIVQQNTQTNWSIFALVDGLKTEIPLINEGTTATFYIPSGLAYGTKEQLGVPANANLIFEIKLISFSE